MNEGREASDGDLIRQVLEGEVGRYAILIERYRREFARYATSLTGDTDLAADALQEAFIRAFDALAKCREPDRFKAWFFRILTNRCHTVRGRWRREAQLEGQDPPAAERSDKAVERNEIRDLINRALGQLTTEQREAFVLKHVEERPYEEISELTGVGVDALKMRVYRARETLREYLEAHMEDAGL